MTFAKTDMMLFRKRIPLDTFFDWFGSPAPVADAKINPGEVTARPFSLSRRP